MPKNKRFQKIQLNKQPKSAEERQPPAIPHGITNERFYQKAQIALVKRQVRAAERLNWITILTAVVGLVGLLILWSTLWVTKNAADAAKDQAKAAFVSAQTAQQQLELSERPWLSIKHRIVKPLTFNVPASKGPIAEAVIEDTIENLGPTVALDVLSWEDIIPIDDPVSLIRSARARQNQWCDANRHPQPGSMAGFYLFPKEQLVQHSTVGPLMYEVMKVANANRDELSGKVGFVLVGCVCYRFPFEAKDAPRHETRFMYFLGKIEDSGGMMPYVYPSGIASDLQLIKFPDGFSAD